jgi:hypothetical protein
LVYTYFKGVTMTLPGEGHTGAQHNRLTMEGHQGLLNGLDEAGWLSAGGYDGELPVQVSIVRQQGRGSIYLDKAVYILHLADGGEYLPGYGASADAETGELTAVGYEGPADERYEKFLGDTIKLGHYMDQELISNSPYPKALEQWRVNHQSWARRPAVRILDAGLSDGLRAVRDHVVFRENGLAEFQGLLAGYVGESTIADKQSVLPLVVATSNMIEVLTMEELGDTKDAIVGASLIAVDEAIRQHAEAKEVALLQDPEVAEAFLREILIDNPERGWPPLSDEDFAKLIDLTDSPNMGRAEKISLVAQSVYRTPKSLTPKGMFVIMNTESQMLGGQTSLQVINSGQSPDDLARDWMERGGLFQ